jgi:hypothetical protein
VFHAFDARTNYDVWGAAVDRATPPRPLLQTEFDEVKGQMSPSG